MAFDSNESQALKSLRLMGIKTLSEVEGLRKLSSSKFINFCFDTWIVKI